MCNVFEEADNSYWSNSYFMFDSHEIIIDNSELIVVQLTSLCPLWAAKKMRKAVVTLREMFLSSKEHKNDRGSYLKRKQNIQRD